MSVKRVLIIQTDDTYFLHETLQVLMANAQDLQNLELTVLASPRAFDQYIKSGAPAFAGVTTDLKTVLDKEFDLSMNLSLNEASWQIHSDIRAEKKSGAFYRGPELMVNGLWSAWFLTFKSNTPFVTFHMREIFRNILGLKKKTPEREHTGPIRTIISGAVAGDIFPREEQEAFLSGVVRRFPGVQVLDESEVTPDTDCSIALYVGPASMKSLSLCESGARAVFIGSRFQGLNLLPEKEGTFLVTSGGKKISAVSLLDTLEFIQKDTQTPASHPLNVYRLSRENVFGAYLQCLTGDEVSYPFYQAHTVLWNYLLALQDVDLDIQTPTEEQNKILDSQLEILEKLLRLHKYAMSALDATYKEAKSETSDAEKIQKHLTTITEVDETFDKISASNSFLRPVIDFYKIRKAQTDGETLLERAQNSLLTYTEEHQALNAFSDLLRTIRQRK